MSNSTPSLVMLHLGLGSFHRAHQALYMHQLIASGDTRWSLAGGNIRPDMAETIAALVAQGGEYTLETITPDNTHSYTRVTSIKAVIPFEPGLAGLIARAIDPATRIISFTVTEAGYYLDPNNQLDSSLPDVTDDLAAVKAGQPGSTIYGALAVMLKARMQAGSGPVTLLCCDNLRHNGDRSRCGLVQFITKLGDSDLLAWVEANTTSPNGMVDRITPRLTPDVAERVLAATGWADAAPVMGESFIQWVIEDNFCAGRPQWEKVGVEMVELVAPYEEAKIRILNATHGCVAWAGTLLGLTYIHEDVAVPEIRQMAYDYVTNDVIPCLDRPESPSPIDLAAYRDVVLDRFSNPFVRDTNARVAADGSTKLDGFISPTVRDRLAQGESIASVARLPALFLAFLERWNAETLPFDYYDHAISKERCHAICTAPDPVAELTREPAFWGEAAGSPALLESVRHAYKEVDATLARLR